MKINETLLDLDENKKQLALKVYGFLRENRQKGYSKREICDRLRNVYPDADYESVEYTLNYLSSKQVIRENHNHYFIHRKFLH